MLQSDKAYFKLIAAKVKEITAQYKLDLAIFQLAEMIKELAKQTEERK